MAKKTSVRLMAPFSMHCSSCSHFIYKSTKFNARKSSTGEQYLGIAILRFSIRCPSCGGEIVFRTDPKTGGFVVISGADRNLEPWHDKAAEAETVDARLARLAREADPNDDKYGRDRVAGFEPEDKDAAEPAASEPESDALVEKRGGSSDREDENHGQKQNRERDASSSLVGSSLVSSSLVSSSHVSSSLIASAGLASPKPLNQPAPATNPALPAPRVAKLPIPKRRKHLAKQP